MKIRKSSSRNGSDRISPWRKWCWGRTGYKIRMERSWRCWCMGIDFSGRILVLRRPWKSCERHQRPKINCDVEILRWNILTLTILRIRRCSSIIYSRTMIESIKTNKLRRTLDMSNVITNLSRKSSSTASLSNNLQMDDGDDEMYLLPWEKAAFRRGRLWTT